MYGGSGPTRPMTDAEAEAWAQEDRLTWVIEVEGELVGQVSARVLDPGSGGTGSGSACSSLDTSAAGTARQR